MYTKGIYLWSKLWAEVVEDVHDTVVYNISEHLQSLRCDGVH